MNLAVFANIYDCDYIHEWRQGIASQFDKDFEIVYYEHKHINTALERILDNYTHLLFLDIDDIPQPALISTAKQYLDYDVVGFGRRLFGEKEGMFGIPDGGFNLGAYYVWGFGNTMYSTDILTELMPLTTDYDTVRRAFPSHYSMEWVDLPLIHYRTYGQNDKLVKYQGRWVWKS